MEDTPYPQDTLELEQLPAVGWMLGDSASEVLMKPRMMELGVPACLPPRKLAHSLPRRRWDPEGTWGPRAKLSQPSVLTSCQPW